MSNRELAKAYSFLHTSVPTSITLVTHLMLGMTAAETAPPGGAGTAGARPVSAGTAGARPVSAE